MHYITVHSCFSTLLFTNLYNFPLDGCFLKTTKKNPGDLKEILDNVVEKFEKTQDSGRVIYVGDGIARVNGLSNAMIGEIIKIDRIVQGIVLNLEEN